MDSVNIDNQSSNDDVQPVRFKNNLNISNNGQVVNHLILVENVQPNTDKNHLRKN